jgi:hypothetical protein
MFLQITRKSGNPPINLVLYFVSVVFVAIKLFIIISLILQRKCSVFNGELGTKVL